jgi:nitroimidazol reductase NimA-like FMN-containing flavoprotein (pyridoxamine 5'-phosphate oxidase superfamily)
VPLFYGYGPSGIYLGVAEGRKTAVLDADPRLSIVVAEVGADEAWRSVVVTGRAAWVTAPSDRAEAVAVLVAHNKRVRERTGVAPPAQPRRHGPGRILRVADPVITGRAKG